MSVFGTCPRFQKLFARPPTGPTSIARTAVVPIATTRPLLIVSDIARAVSSETENISRMHFVIFYQIGGNRFERVETNVESDMGKARARAFDARDQFGREVKSGCRGRGGTVLLGVNCLVAIRIG